MIHFCGGSAGACFNTVKCARVHSRFAENKQDNSPGHELVYVLCTVLSKLGSPRFVACPCESSGSQNTPLVLCERQSKLHKPPGFSLLQCDHIIPDMQQIEQAILISFAGSHVGVEQQVKVWRFEIASSVCCSDWRRHAG